MALIAAIKLGPRTPASSGPRMIGWADGSCSNVELEQKPVVVADGLRTLVRTLDLCCYLGRSRSLVPAEPLTYLPIK